ncbi:MAG: M20/M25/M40 family metallo-hydrolase [Acidobacteria bacterium]|nr:M20/M25/M40 family metallo-hydrolase [Acidobacteriota bacterium]
MTLETAQIRTQWATTGGRMPTAAAAGGRAGGAPAPAVVRIVLDKATHAAVAAMPDGAKVDFQCTVVPGYTWNAAGRLTGTDPAQKEQVILLGAHLDHIGARTPVAGTDTIFNGADDDASGVTAVLELAAALSKAPRGKRTIVFGFFGSEESGGFGANHFVTKPVIPLDKIVAMLQFEMLGRPDPLVADKTLWLTGYERSNLGVELARQGARLVQDPHPDQSFFTRSDNIRFAYEGVISHTVSSFNLHKDYHQASDEVKTIDFAHMTMAIQSMYAPVVWLSNSTFVPTWYENCRPIRGQGGRGGAAAAPGAAAPAPCKANGKG